MKAKLVLPLLAVLSLPAWGQQVEMKAVKEKIPTYQIGSPQFDEIRIRMGRMNAGGRTFTIRTENNSDKAYYVQSAAFNGKPLDQCWLYRSDVYNGGELVLRMGEEPSDVWSDSKPAVSR